MVTSPFPSPGEASPERVRWLAIASHSLGHYLDRMREVELQGGLRVFVPESARLPILLLDELGRVARASEIAHELRLDTPRIANALNRWTDGERYGLISRRGERGPFALSDRGQELAAVLARVSANYVLKSQRGQWG